MKRAFLLFLLTFAAAPGCMNLNPFGSAPAPKEAPKPLPPPPAVLADEITPENAHQKADALSKELAFDAAGNAATPAAPADAAKH